MAVTGPVIEVTYWLLVGVGFDANWQPFTARTFARFTDKETCVIAASEMKTELPSGAHIRGFCAETEPIPLYSGE